MPSDRSQGFRPPTGEAGRAPPDLLFEIGCEEIPAKMLAKQLADLPKLVGDRLAAARLEHAGVSALGTPRRVAVIVKALADRQPDLDEEVVGPPVSAAFAADGSVTKAGQGFAAKNGVDPATLLKKEVPGKKGQYAVAQRSVVGQDTRTLVPALLADVAKAIAWPKSQRWGWGETTFVRPVQWLVALLGGEVIPLTWANLTAGRASRGHRFLHPGSVEIASADRYVEALKAAHVIVDPAARKDIVRGELARLERETGLRVRPDEPLLDEVINLGEFPVGVSGEFDPAVLEGPEEMIVTAMRTHQRYFAMEDATGKLANRFATMMATIVKDPAVVSQGNQKVIAARLSDAKFFFAEDRKKSFDDWNHKLDSVVFQAKLGDRAKMIGHKVRRLMAFMKAQAEGLVEDVKVAVRAAELAKGDLASSAVGEFPELQGVMGRHYAHHAGESVVVETAIEEHWWPKGQGGQLPKTIEGALLAIADRIDTLVGCFATGLVPSGNADPLGLRRAAIGVLTILLDRGRGGAHETANFPSSVDSLSETAANGFHDAIRWTDESRSQLRDFIAARLRTVLVDDERLDAQAVEVALGASSGNPADVRIRARHLAEVPRETRAAFKRIGNILDDPKAKQVAQTVPDPTRFTASAETTLWNAFQERRSAIHHSIDTREYREAFRMLAELGPALSTFFDKGGVMVMDPDLQLRENRLAVLQAIYDPFIAIGDFRNLI
ncbi:MAG: glycine--tRNA ligase subunit beta [Kofleriaceae bacterium]